jgi:hypothetical protein
MPDHWDGGGLYRRNFHFRSLGPRFAERRCVGPVIPDCGAPRRSSGGITSFPSSGPVRKAPRLIQRHTYITQHRSRQLQCLSILCLSQDEWIWRWRTFTSREFDSQHRYSYPYKGKTSILFPAFRFPLVQGRMMDRQLICSIFCRNNRRWDMLPVVT